MCVSGDKGVFYASLWSDSDKSMAMCGRQNKKLFNAVLVSFNSTQF
jgi:hypothetical protein